MASVRATPKAGTGGTGSAGWDEGGVRPAPTLLGDTRVGRHVRVPKTAELVAAHLRRQIVRGELVEGDALPPEAVLMEQFGVSRPTLREAFRVLESEALISVRRGAHGGARVHTPDGHVAARYAGLVLEHTGTTIADVHTAATLLEPPCIRLLATHATDAAVTRLRTALAITDSALAVPHSDPDTVATQLTDFHRLLINLAGNHTLTMIISMLRDILHTATLNQPPREPATPPTTTPPGATTPAGSATPATGHPDAPRDHHRTHQHLVRLVADHDAEAAEALWRTHLTQTRDPTPATILDLLG
jgi:DNA-binding FadR family transcriptional regulator